MSTLESLLRGCDNRCRGNFIMSINKSLIHGKINITNEAIAQVAADAALGCYGVLGLAAKNSLESSIQDILKRDDYIKGVYCRKKKDGYEVDLYLTVAYGMKITVILSEVQKTVAYILEKTFGLKFLKINVFVQNIKEAK